MGVYDGSHISVHSRKSRNLIQTACNLLQHCILVSEEESNESNLSELLLNLDNPFNVTGETEFISAIQSTSAARAYIVESDTCIVIAFRGSKVEGDGQATFQNILTDINIQLIRDGKFNGKVHRGFSEDYMQIGQEIIERLENLNLEKRIFVTGFSLGAALATLCAYDLKKQLNIDPNVYLFAAPAVGDHDFTREFERIIQTVFRFAHRKDVISQIPHGLFCEYKASGNKLLVFDTKGNQVHHNKLKMLIKIKRSWSKTIRHLYIVKTIISFREYHNPAFYKRKLARLHINYDDNKSNSSLVQTSERQYQKSPKFCLG